MNIKDRLNLLLKEHNKISVYIIGETEGYIVGFISKVEEDFIEVQMRNGLKIVPIEKIGYITLHPE